MSHSTFTRDNRAVAPVIGFILMIGILVLLLAVYQAQIVPQQNAETELEHHQETRDELRSLDHAISAVGADETPRFESITLGTAYESRIFAINPPPAAGTIQTEQHNITITNQNGSRTNISTQFIEYQPGYNELDIGSTWYENSVVYFDERDRGNSVSVIEDQEIVQDGDVTIIALQNEIQETRTGRVTLELYPSSNVNNVSLPEEDGNYMVNVPTRVNGTEYWNDALVNAGDIYQGVDETGDGEPDMLNLSVDPDALEPSSVGIRLEPDEEPESRTESEEEGAENLDPENEEGNLIGGGATGEGQGGPGKFEFGLRNTGERDLNIIAMGIINTSTDANIVTRSNNNQPRLTQEEDLIFDDIEIDDNTNDAKRYDFEESVSIAGGETEEEFEFNRFRNNESPGQSAENMRDSSLNITVWVIDEDDAVSQTTLLLRDE